MNITIPVSHLTDPDDAHRIAAVIRLLGEPCSPTAVVALTFNAIADALDAHGNTLTPVPTTDSDSAHWLDTPEMAESLWRWPPNDDADADCPEHEDDE